VGDQKNTVGYYIPSSDPAYGPEWIAHRDFNNADDAARYIHWLNGGNSIEAWFEGDRR
jgi:hypothetical protein